MAVEKYAQQDRDTEDLRFLEKQNVFFTSFEKLWNWGRARSFWPLGYGCNCCPMELMASSAARFDIARFGYEVFRQSPRQSDVLLVAGPVTVKMKPVVERLWAQMPEPKWVVAMGNCACSGDPSKTVTVSFPAVISFYRLMFMFPAVLRVRKVCFTAF